MKIWILFSPWWHVNGYGTIYLSVSTDPICPECYYTTVYDTCGCHKCQFVLTNGTTHPVLMGELWVYFVGIWDNSYHVIMASHYNYNKVNIFYFIFCCSIMIGVIILTLLASSSALDLSHNQLIQVPRDVPSEEDSLNLSHNNITTISTHAFISLSDLTSLDLKNNLINTVEEGAFAGLSSLHTLNMANNRLKSVPPDISSIVTLRILFVFGNPIQMIQFDDLEFSTYLHDFRIGWTWLRHFPPLPYCPNMTTLYLRGNRLREYPQDFFQRLPNLITLRLGYNKLASFPEFGDCQKKLRFLHLDYNWLYSIPDLSGYHSLRFLDLSHNYISALADDTLSGIAGSIVNLYGNPISCMHGLCGLASSNLSAIVTFTCPDGLQWQEVDRELLCEGLWVNRYSRYHFRVEINPENIKIYFYLPIIS